jgi:ribonuclease Y
MEIVYYLIVLIAGAGVGYTLASTAIRKSIENKSKQLLKDAEAESEVIKKDKILQAKEKFLQLKAEHEKAVQIRNNEIQQAENRIKQKESTLAQKIEENKRKQSEFDSAKER